MSEDKYIAVLVDSDYNNWKFIGIFRNRDLANIALETFGESEWDVTDENILYVPCRPNELISDMYKKSEEDNDL